MKIGDIVLNKKTKETVVILNEVNSETFLVVNSKYNLQKRMETTYEVNINDLEEVEAEYNIPVTYSMYGIQKVTAKSLDEAIEFFDEHIDDFPLPDDPQYLDDSYYRDEDRNGISVLQ